MANVTAAVRLVGRVAASLKAIPTVSSAEMALPTATGMLNWLIYVKTYCFGTTRFFLCALSQFNVRMPTEALKRTTVSAIRSKECPKCGTNKKSGKLSCCARGGTWFQKCGQVGDTNFDNTWVEGIHVCNDFASSLLVQAPTQAGRDRIMSQSTSTNELRNAAQQDVNIDPTSKVSDADTADCTDHVLVAKIAVFTSSLLIHLCLQITDVY